MRGIKMGRILFFAGINDYSQHGMREDLLSLFYTNYIFDVLFSALPG